MHIDQGICSMPHSVCQARIVESIDSVKIVAAADGIDRESNSK
jgi:hypothetical protein